MTGRGQGTQANRTGRVLENMVESVFGSHGYQTVKYAAYAADPDMPGDLLIRNVPYQTLYGHKGKS